MVMFFYGTRLIKHRMPSHKSAFFVYWIRAAPNHHYIGATVDMPHRLRQHNGLIAGGAKRTSGKGPWSVECVVSGFRTWREALQFEWAFKYHTRRRRRIDTRYDALCDLMRSEKWTSNAPPARDVPLRVSSIRHTSLPSASEIVVAAIPAHFAMVSSRAEQAPLDCGVVDGGHTRHAASVVDEAACRDAFP